MVKQAVLIGFLLALSAVCRVGVGHAAAVVVVRNSTIVDSFVGTHGMQFALNGTSLYFSGFNAYWMMLVAASDTAARAKVSSMLQDASAHGLNLARAWAFSDGGDFPLQTSPGVYNETMFQGLDFVISEAKKQGIYLVLSLANNYKDFGGRPQYVEWAKEKGENVSSDDDFYTNDVVRGYYKNNVKEILTRVNNFTGVAYKDDPTILAWELINEPRCQVDTSGATLQTWIGEMAAYAKSIDQNHLVEVGLEGFYGASSKDRQQLNPGGSMYGTDFVSNNQVQGIDFATIHAYPAIWLPGSDYQTQLSYLQNWTRAHLQDTQQLVNKPLLFTEFGKSVRDNGSGIGQRNEFLRAAFDSIYDSAANGGALVGGLFWQLLGDGLDGLKDGFEIVLPDDPSVAKIISDHSLRLSKLGGKHF